MAELADARDLKSREIYFSYRFDPGFRHHYIAEWSSLVARRAHNPKVMRFKSHLRNQKIKPTLAVGFIFCSRSGLCSSSMTFGTKGMGERDIKRLITVFGEAMSRVASRQSRVYRGERRRHKSRRGKQIPSHQPSRLVLFFCSRSGLEPRALRSMA